MVATRSIVDDLSAYGVARSTTQGTPLDKEELRKIHAFWSACNYLALGMIYLQGNPLLREPLKAEHIKNRMLGLSTDGRVIEMLSEHTLEGMLEGYLLTGSGHSSKG